MGDLARTRELSEETLDMAIALNLPVFNSLYVAAARRSKARLYTADKRLLDASKTFIESDLLD